MVGSVQSEAIGPFHAEKETATGELFHALLLKWRLVLPDPGNLRPLREGHSHRQDHLQEAVSVPHREQGHHDLDRLLVQRWCVPGILA